MKIVLTLLFLIVLNLHTKAQHTSESDKIKPADNSDLIKMYNEDQNGRSGVIVDWAQLEKDDSSREKRVYELIKEGKVITGKDHYHSAMIFQHGRDSVAYHMAVELMRKAVALDSTINKWLLAAAIDRELMSKNQPQIYGTQYVKKLSENKWERYLIDTTKVSDKERAYYGVQTLALQKIRERNMNLLSLSQYYRESGALHNTLTLIEKETAKGAVPTYDVSESGINALGYDLIRSGKKEQGLVVFILNAQLYPESFNTYDSLGECFLLLNRKEEGLKAYRKSLELNPKNANAIKVLNEHR